MTLSAVASFTASCVITYAVHGIVSWGVRKAFSFFFPELNASKSPPNVGPNVKFDINLPYCRLNIG